LEHPLIIASLLQVIATACLFLAAKMEESPKSIKVSPQDW
jgi:hypothetical protein